GERYTTAEYRCRLTATYAASKSIQSDVKSAMERNKTESALVTNIFEKRGTHRPMWSLMNIFWASTTIWVFSGPSWQRAYDSLYARKCMNSNSTLRWSIRSWTSCDSSTPNAL